MFRPLCILVVLAVAVSDNSSVTYNPTAGGFQVSFPKKPTVKEASPATNNLHVAAVQRTAIDELSFVCQWKVKDKAYENKDAERAYLKGQQLGIVNGLKGKLIEEKEIKTDGFHGLKYTVQAPNMVFRNCSFISGKRIVTLMVIGKDTDAVRSESATKFLESFKESK